jgi:hypothetical protein
MSQSRITFSWFLLLMFASHGHLYARLVILPSDDPSEKVCSGQDIANALEEIRQTDPALGLLIDELENSDKRHTIKPTDGITTSTGYNTDHHQEIEFNPRLNRRFPASGVPIDAVAGLVHELWHAYENQNNIDPQTNYADLQRNREFRVNGIMESEYNAVRTENLYRSLHGLCSRVEYDGDPLLPQDILSPCDDPWSVPNPEGASQCTRGCCYIRLAGPTVHNCGIVNISEADCLERYRQLQSQGLVTGTDWFKESCQPPEIPSCP